MPLEPALNYQNNADFTSRLLVPLLRRLGYSIVAEYHGQRPSLGATQGRVL